MAMMDNKFSTIQVEYETEKLEAVRIYLRDKNSTVERELADAIESVFKKVVPVAVREYIERKNAPPPKPLNNDQQIKKKNDKTRFLSFSQTLNSSVKRATWEACPPRNRFLQANQTKVRNYAKYTQKR